MENIEVHSKNFLIRWIHTDQGGHVSWKVVPLKRSINFCVFIQRSNDGDSQAVAKKFIETSGKLTERLEASGFVPLIEGDDFHRLDNSQPISGSAEVMGNQLLAFVFDNTFSISNSKHVQFSVNIAGHHKPKQVTATQTGIIDESTKRSLAAAAAGAALYDNAGLHHYSDPQSFSHKNSSHHGSLVSANLNGPSYFANGPTNGNSSSGGGNSFGNHSHAGGTAPSDSVSNSVPNGTNGTNGTNGVQCNSSGTQGLQSGTQSGTQGTQNGVPNGNHISVPDGMSNGTPSTHLQTSASNSTVNPASNPSANLAGPPVGSANSASSAAVMRKRSSMTNHASSSDTSLNNPKPFNRRRNTANSTINSDSDSGARTLRSRHGTISSINDGEIMTSLDNRYVTGYLQKKRRKHFQGFAKRYFSLDRKTGLLNYYLNNRSSSLRGVMPVKISDIQADKKSLLVSLDSGMEKWVLKTSDRKSFETWCAEFKRLRASPDGDVDHDLGSEDGYTSTEIDTEVDHNSPTKQSELSNHNQSQNQSQSQNRNPVLEIENKTMKQKMALVHNKLQRSAMNQSDEQVRDLLLAFSEELTDSSEMALSRNTKRNSIKNIFTKPKDSVPPPPVEENCESTGIFVDLCFATFLVLTSFFLGGIFSWKRLMGLLITTVVSVLDRNNSNGRCIRGAIISKITRTLHAYQPQPVSTNLETEPSQIVSTEDDDVDYFSGSEDEDKSPNRSVSYVPQVPEIPETNSNESESQESRKNSGGRTSRESKEESLDESNNSASSANSATSTLGNGTAGTTGTAKPLSIVAEHDAETDSSNHHTYGRNKHKEHQTAETSLYPLPLSKVQRRTFIAGPVKPPPSLLSMIKRSKDASNAAAPVTANEPLSGLQAVAELFENSELLDEASKSPPKSPRRLMYVAVFAVSRIASARCKERALRKPFTPLLGETYEMVREDKGFRYVCEKVQHKPEVIATQTESPLWTIHFTSRPHTKLWPKSVQYADVGHVSITFPDGETVSYLNAQLFIKNILAGERYVEPYGEMHVESSKSSSVSALVEFKAGGLFSGRSEEVKISSGQLSYHGKWTEGIYDTDDKPIWVPKPLVKDPNKHYGWTQFAVELNEITEIEETKLPPNDSRLRPDLRLYEQQEVDVAEDTKLDLEQKQRDRRKHLEIAHEHHEPFFFVKSNDSRGHFILRRGDSNYWVRRQHNNWAKIPNYFE